MTIMFAISANNQISHKIAEIEQLLVCMAVRHSPLMLGDDGGLRVHWSRSVAVVVVQGWRQGQG